MSIKVGCIQCGKVYQVDDRFAGKKAKCKACGNVLEVPAAAPRPAVNAAAKVAVASASARQATAKPAKPVQRAARQPAAAPAASAGEFDFSAMDDIERSGTIDDSPQAAIAVAPPKDE